MQKITPFLWFNNQAEEAMNFYISIFKNSKPLKVNRYGDNAPIQKGMVMTASFELNGQEFIALNGGPHFTFTPAVSFVVNCEDQNEVDEYWEKLSEGGEKQRCGWLKDKYGVSWQIIPTELSGLLNNSDALKAHKATKALMQMSKIDIALVRQAFDN